MSHPAWVCGLKQMWRYISMCGDTVTPRVGVRIETKFFHGISTSPRSHPAWVCGLKRIIPNVFKHLQGHTPRGCAD